MTYKILKHGIKISLKLNRYFPQKLMWEMLEKSKMGKHLMKLQKQLLKLQQRWNKNSWRNNV